MFVPVVGGGLWDLYQRSVFHDVQQLEIPLDLHVSHSDHVQLMCLKWGTQREKLVTLLHR